MVEIRIPVSGEGDLREITEDVDKEVVSVCSSMFRSDMTSENEDDYFAHKTNTLVSLYRELWSPWALSQMTTHVHVHWEKCACGVVLSLHRGRVHGSSDYLNATQKKRTNLMQILDKIDCKVKESGNNNEEIKKK